MVSNYVDAGDIKFMDSKLSPLELNMATSPLLLEDQKIGIPGW